DFATSKHPSSFVSICSVIHQDLHSFPTRRSSDLVASSSNLTREQNVASNMVAALPSREEKKPRQSPNTHPASRRCGAGFPSSSRSEEHTSELQSLAYLVCRLLLEKKKIKLTIPQR